jgi:hypothetical protein
MIKSNPGHAMGRNSRWLCSTVLASIAGCGSLALDSTAAQAQIFCPTTVNGGQQQGIRLDNGTCTNVGNVDPRTSIGAFSNAALASQALSDLAQGTTQQTSEVVRTSVEGRRETEQERCPEGFVRGASGCQRVAIAEPSLPPAAEPGAPARDTRRPPRERRAAPAPSPAPAPRAPARPRPTIVKPPPLEPAARYGTWAQGYGDFERRTGVGRSSINCCQGAGGIAIPLALTGESRATSAGLVGGLDTTLRNLSSAGDGLILGILYGYTSTDVKFTTTSVSNPPNANVQNGSSQLKARVEGGSFGGYATYFNDRFSADATVRADFLSLNESFVDTLGFTANVGNPIPVAAAQATFAGAGSTRLINYTAMGNLNYRLPVTSDTWWEPTAGFQYTASDYDSSAAALGLKDGHLIRLQGGVRFGVNSYLPGAGRLTTTITGIVYDNVEVTGGFIQNIAFGNNALILNDQGKLRGQGILAFKLDRGNGFSVFAQGDVRGGEGLFGGGGRGGFRYEW